MMQFIVLSEIIQFFELTRHGMIQIFPCWMDQIVQSLDDLDCPALGDLEWNVQSHVSPSAGRSVSGQRPSAR